MGTLFLDCNLGTCLEENRLGFLVLACSIFLTCVLLRGTTKDDCLVKNAIPPILVLMFENYTLKFCVCIYK